MPENIAGIWVVPFFPCECPTWKMGFQSGVEEEEEEGTFFCWGDWWSSGLGEKIEKGEEETN